LVEAAVLAELIMSTPAALPLKRRKLYVTPEVTLGTTKLELAGRVKVKTCTPLWTTERKY